jgi:hypothetical protein
MFETIMPSSFAGTIFRTSSSTRFTSCSVNSIRVTNWPGSVLGKYGFSAIYKPNSAEHTAFVQVSLKEGHDESSAFGASQRGP